MPIKVTCSKCQGVLHAPDDAGGKRGKCPTCGNVLAIPGGSMIPPDPDQPLAQTPFNAAPPPRQASTVFGSSGTDDRRGSFAPGLTGSGSPMSAPMPDGRPAIGNRVAGVQEPRKSGDPFSKSGPRSSPAEADVASRSWRQTRRGLWFVQAGYFCALVAVVAPAALTIAVKAGVKLPDNPGLLKLEELRLPTEILYASFLIPAALAFLLLTLGRVGAASAPRASYARGLFQASALATLFSLLGVIALTVVIVAQVAIGLYPGLMLPDDVQGMVQRVGIAVAAVLAPMAELWFVVALGRMGAGLHDDRLAGRGTRALVYAGLLFIVAGLVTYAVSYYHGEINQMIADQVQPKLTTLGDKQAFVVPGIVIAAGLIVWLVYVRLVGAARGAIHGWLDANRG
jgi:hypothetical protein